MTTLVFELSVILITTATLCTIAELTKQPLIPAYILAGLILGNNGLHIIESNEFFTAISEVGIILLLYLIGLELKPKLFFNSLKKSSLIVLISIIINLVFGVLIYLTMDINAIKLFYFITALFFSSTVVVMKTIVESKNYSQTVYDTCLGMLLIQDIIAIIILLTLNSQELTGTLEFVGIFQFIIYGTGVIVLSWFMQKWLLRAVIRQIMHRSDVVFLIGLAWCFFFAELAEVLHLSREIGAFIAGLAITSLPERKQRIFAEKSETIRDFFMVLFFFMMGANFQINNWGKAIPLLILGIAFVSIIKPLSIYGLSKLMKFTQHQSIEIGIRMSQISEFSIIVALLGMKIGHIDNDFVSTIQLILFITILLSGYVIHYIIPKLTAKTTTS